MSKSTDKKQAILDWINQIMDEHRLTPTALAYKAGVSPSTITRVLEPDWSGNMRALTLKAISEATGTRPPAAILPKPEGFSEHKDEVQEIEFDKIPQSPFIKRLASHVEGNNTLVMMVLQTDCLAAAGLLSGDRLIVDLNRKPRSGDIVCVRHYDWRNGTAETLIRIYEPPYILSHNLDKRPEKPLMVDDDAIVIKGVVVHQFRDFSTAA